MVPLMKTARYKYRFYPTQEQKHQLAQTFGCARFVYNWGLEQQLCARQADEKMPSMTTLSKRLTHLKKDDDHTWLHNVSSVPLQQSLRHLSRAWTNCFEKRAKPPRFKRKYHKQAAEYTKCAFSIKNGDVYLAKMDEPLDIRWSRELPSEPSSCTVMRDRIGRYKISFVVEVDPHIEYTGHAQVGIDVGLKHFAVLSDGTKIDNPAFLKKELAALTRAQRSLARKKKGSRNYVKAKRRVATIHARIADKRRDFLHKLSTRLVAENQGLAVEDLNVEGMSRNRCLARAIMDAGWGMFRRMLEYKCDWYGRTLHVIDRFFPSSKTCSECGHVLDTLALDVRRWPCPECGADHDRDINAAQNIAKAAGHAVRHVCGEKTTVQHEGLRVFVVHKSSR